MKNKPINHGKRWTIQQDFALFILAVSKTPIERIAYHVQRTAKAAATRLATDTVFRCGDHKAAIESYLYSLDKEIIDYKATVFFRQRAYRIKNSVPC